MKTKKPIIKKSFGGNVNIGTAANANRLIIHYINPARFPGMKGSNTFKTTETFNEIRSIEDAMFYVNKNLQDIRKATWNNIVLAENSTVYER